MKKNVLFLILTSLLLLTPTLLQAQGWTNPMVLPGLENRSLGDPYIMKYRGYYYLYVSAGDEKIYCWRSKDLMEWSSDYICCTDATTAVAYAPEVIYWNGKFYMCTSPRGGGHYMLTSDSPTGPFVHQTGNMGRDIDGSMFVDDDGKWYFYHANNGGIRGCTMPTHLSYGDDVDLGCCMSGQWTEGPCVFKRNGLYYLIYTGNHVWTNGYRIDYAISKTGPLSGFHPQSEQNPILVDTETPTHKALGHGTAFVGPDLDTYFFCYHNLQDNKSRRLLNFERIGWNGDKLMMTGPTDWEQDRPLVATNDYFERPEIGGDWALSSGGQWQIADNEYLTQTSAEGNHKALFKPCSYNEYTAEFTLKAANGSTAGTFGAIFSYKDDENYSEALIDITANNLVVNNYTDGALSSSKQYPLPTDFNPACWHSIRIEKNETKVRVYIDGMRKYVVTSRTPGGQIGYVTDGCAADFDYTAISPYVDGSGILDVSIPVPGILAANLCFDKTDDVKASSYTMTAGSAYYMRGSVGSKMTYRINVQKDNIYNIGVRYRSGVSHIKLYVDDEVLNGNIELPATRSGSAVYTLQDVPLKEGRHELTIEVIDGTIFFYDYNFKRSVATPHVMADDFNEGFSPEWGYKEGSWNIVDGQLESTGNYGKMLMGGFDDIHLTDYTVECDVNYLSSGAMNGGLLFRTTNASTGGADDNPVLGSDFLQGYIFIAETTSVALGKHNYGWQTLASAAATVDPAVTHHMKVEVEGATFRCYMDNMDEPLITYTDTNPFITGRAGFRTHNSCIRFDNFVVTPAEKEKTAIQPLPTTEEEDAQQIFYNLQGQKVSDIAGQPKGVYIIKERKHSRKVIR